MEAAALVVGMVAGESAVDGELDGAGVDKATCGLSKAPGAKLGELDPALTAVGDGARPQDEAQFFEGAEHAAHGGAADAEGGAQSALRAALPLFRSRAPP